MVSTVEVYGVRFGTITLQAETPDITLWTKTLSVSFRQSAMFFVLLEIFENILCLFNLFLFLSENCPTFVQYFAYIFSQDQLTSVVEVNDGKFDITRGILTIRKLETKMEGNTLVQYMQMI